MLFQICCVHCVMLDCLSVQILRLLLYIYASCSAKIHFSTTRLTVNPFIENKFVVKLCNILFLFYFDFTKVLCTLIFLKHDTSGTILSLRINKKYTSYILYCLFTGTEEIFYLYLEGEVF